MPANVPGSLVPRDRGRAGGTRQSYDPLWLCSRNGRASGPPHSSWAANRSPTFIFGSPILPLRGLEPPLCQQERDTKQGLALTTMPRRGNRVRGCACRRVGTAPDRLAQHFKPRRRKSRSTVSSPIVACRSRTFASCSRESFRAPPPANNSGTASSSCRFQALTYPNGERLDFEVFSSDPPRSTLRDTSASPTGRRSATRRRCPTRAASRSRWRERW